VKPETTNRDIATLKACLNKAVEWGVVPENPIARVKLARVDKSTPIRVLSLQEEQQLRDALRSRDADLRVNRESANEWRDKRGYPLQRRFGHFADHLEPIVLLALNTGMRRGELLHLRWDDLDNNALTVRGSGSKNQQTRVIPLNGEAGEVLRFWTSDSDWIFPGKLESALTTIKRSWTGLRDRANLPDVRFHDLRHTFATRLLQRGVDIKTVSSLLGHQDIAVTARYLHATDDSKRKAVELL
jgi:integrase